MWSVCKWIMRDKWRGIVPRQTARRNAWKVAARGCAERCRIFGSDRCLLVEWEMSLEAHEDKSHLRSTRWTTESTYFHTGMLWFWCGGETPPMFLFLADIKSKGLLTCCNLIRFCSRMQTMRAAAARRLLGLAASSYQRPNLINGELLFPNWVCVHGA